MGRRARNRPDRADPAAAPRERTGRARGRPKRERLGREAPGSVLGGPPIAVTCECGSKHDVRYGEAWTCERCGRRWDTNQIPREDYEVIRRTQLRFRVLPVAVGLLVVALAVFFTLTGNLFSVFFLRPAHRRRYRRAIAELPRWELHPE